LKSSECTHPDNPFLTKNLVFFGTLCLEGRGEGIVVQIGAKTIVGQIAGLAASGDQHKSPFKVELDHLILIISIISVTITLILFFVGHFAVKYSLKESLIFVIGIILASVP
jgi:sodium/potassium-transporting ATPase subunit alpha